jgi:HEAT repeat protein
MKAGLSCAAAVVALAALSAPLFAAAVPVSVNPARVKVLLKKLDADNFFVRQKADKALRAMGKPVLPLLKAEREKTKSLEVRYRLDRMMQDLTYDERIAEWVRLLGHANPQYREQAGQALRHAGTDVLPILKRELNSDLDAQGKARLEKIIDELSGVRR